MSVPFHLGVDICNVRRMQRSIESGGKRFLDRIFTRSEQAYCNKKRNKYENYAARFAAKEAVVKANKGAKTSSAYSLIEVKRGLNGEPSIYLSKKSRKSLGISQKATFELSITHERDFAAAVVALFQ
jgi:holo-[acyl-carrier protein] synthase